MHLAEGIYSDPASENPTKDPFCLWMLCIISQHTFWDARCCRADGFCVTQEPLLCAHRDSDNAEGLGKAACAVQGAFQTQHLHCLHWSLAGSAGLLLPAFIPIKPLNIIVGTEPWQSELWLSVLLTPLPSFGTNSSAQNAQASGSNQCFTNTP